ARLVYDRNTASRLGITASTIDQTLYDAYGQRQVSTMFTQLNQYHVVLEVKPDFQKDPLDLNKLFVRTGVGAPVSGGIVSGGSSTTGISTGPTNAAAAAAGSLLTAGNTAGSSSVFSGSVPSAAIFPNGGQVPLSTFAYTEMISAPITVNHQGQFPVVTLSF